MGWFNNSSSINLSKCTQPTEKVKAKYQNEEAFQLFFHKFVNMALNRYQITGCPDTVSERVVRESLLYYGTAIFFDYNGSLLCLPGTPADGVTLYGDFNKAFVYGRNGFNQMVTLIPEGSEKDKLLAESYGFSTKSKYEGIMVRENFDYVNPFIFTVAFYASRIADTYRALDVAVDNSKIPYVWAVKDSEYNSIKAFINKKKNNESNIITTGIIDPSKVCVINLSQDGLNSSSNFMQIITFYQNAFKEACGIENMESTNFKKANILSDEMGSNDEWTHRVEDKTLDCINHYLDLVNAHFGTSMKAERIEELEREEEMNDDDGGIFADGTGEESVPEPRD